MPGIAGWHLTYLFQMVRRCSGPSEVETLGIHGKTGRFCPFESTKVYSGAREQEQFKLTILLLYLRMLHCFTTNLCSSFEPHWCVLNTWAWAVNALDSVHCQKEENKSRQNFQGTVVGDGCWLLGATESFTGKTSQHMMGTIKVNIAGNFLLCFFYKTWKWYENDNIICFKHLKQEQNLICSGALLPITGLCFNRICKRKYGQSSLCEAGESEKQPHYLCLTVRTDILRRCQIKVF